MVTDGVNLYVITNVTTGGQFNILQLNTNMSLVRSVSFSGLGFTYHPTKAVLYNNVIYFATGLLSTNIIRVQLSTFQASVLPISAGNRADLVFPSVDTSTGILVCQYLSPCCFFFFVFVSSPYFGL